jgi:hypothetical protein
MAKNKPRKWSNLKGQIADDPEQVELTPRMRTVLQEVDKRRMKENGDPVGMNDLALEWSGLEEEEAFEELRKSERNVTFEALERRILEELERVKEVAGTDLWRGEGQTFSPKYMLNVHVTDPVALLQWVKDTQQEHLLTIPVGRLKGIVGEAMNTDVAAALTPAERAAMKPGAPGSGQPPPGVGVTLHTTVHHTSSTRTRSSKPDDDEGPF